MIIKTKVWDPYVKSNPEPRCPEGSEVVFPAFDCIFKTVPGTALTGATFAIAPGPDFQMYIGTGGSVAAAHVKVDHGDEGAQIDQSESGFDFPGTTTKVGSGWSILWEAKTPVKCGNAYDTSMSIAIIITEPVTGLPVTILMSARLGYQFFPCVPSVL